MAATTKPFVLDILDPANVKPIVSMFDCVLGR